MKRRKIEMALSAALLMSLLAPGAAAQDKSTPASDTALHSAATVESVVRDLYDSVSFEAGKTPDWDRVRSLFHEHAVIVLRTARDKTTIFTVEGFVADFVAFIERSGVARTGFNEKIVRMKATVFGDIAHVLVLYKAAITGSQRPPQQGVDSIQLIRKDGKWLVISIVNEAVLPGAPVPEELQADAPRPAHWAVPVAGRGGLPNLHKVADGLYRGAQPEKEGFAALKEMGVKTVVNLRSVHSDRTECADAGLEYVKITTQAWEGEDDEVVDFLRVVTDPGRMPVFVHCEHGADRTGVMCAAYRIAVQGWSREEAVREMTDGGFGFHPVWKNLVRYVRGIDVKALRESAGIEKEP